MVSWFYEFSCKKGPNHFDLITKIPVFGFYDKTRLKPVSFATDTSQIFEILLVASFDRILSNKPISKLLTRLHRYSGQSAPLLFTNP